MTARTWVLGGLAALVVAGVSIFVYSVERPPGAGGVTGKFQSIDDTGLGSFTIDEGTFLVIPGATVRDVWPEVKQHEGRHYPDLSAGMRDLSRTAEEYGSVLVEVQWNGRFRINVEAGPAVVCLIGSGGCVEVTLPEKGTVNAYWGEGGFGFG